MRQNMATRLDSDQAAREKFLFFGAFHAKNPTDFAFHIGDKLLIKKLVSAVKSRIQKNSFEQFHLDEKKAKRIYKLKDTVQTTIGTFFGTNESAERSRSIHTTTNEESLVDSLYQKSSELILFLGSKETLPQFTKEMCSVEKNGNTIKSFVECIYCRKQRQVFYDQTYFVVSNLKKHLIKCGNIGQKNTPKHDESKVISKFAQITPRNSGAKEKNEVMSAPKTNVTQTMHNKTTQPHKTNKNAVESIESTPKADRTKQAKRNVKSNPSTPDNNVSSKKGHIPLLDTKATNAAIGVTAKNVHHKPPESTNSVQPSPNPQMNLNKPIESDRSQRPVYDTINTEIDDSIVIIDEQDSDKNEQNILSRSAIEISPLDANESAIYFQLCTQNRTMRSA